MSASGRNQPCGCGSGKKTKRCCGLRRGPSQPELDKAFLAGAGRESGLRLVHLERDELGELFDRVVELPERHLSLQLRLPRILSPELEALRYAILADEIDRAYADLGKVLARLDTPVQRAQLARAVLDLGDQLGPQVADAAIVDLASRSRALLRASLIQALSVSAGTSTTPAGLLVLSR
jgi:hypothetical protein